MPLWNVGVEPATCYSLSLSLSLSLKTSSIVDKSWGFKQCLAQDNNYDICMFNHAYDNKYLSTRNDH